MKKTTLLIAASILCLTAVNADMSRIEAILTAESTELNNCDWLNKKSHLSLGQKIAQVVCDSQAVKIQRQLLIAVKFALFGIICSLSTWLITTATKVQVKTSHEKTIRGLEISNLTNLASQNVEPQPQDLKQLNLEVSPTSSLDLLPILEEKIDEALEEKCLDNHVDEVELPEVLEEKDEGKLDQADNENIPPTLSFREDVIDFEDYKRCIDRGHSRLLSRPRSFSEPKGAERYIPYPFSIEDAFQRSSWIGERSPPQEPTPVPFQQAELNAHISDCYPEPGSPARNQLDLVDEVLEEPGCHNLVSQGTPEEQKINERKPMVFVGGVSASTSALELVSELKKQGFNVTVVPRIRYGVSFGFCPDLVLSSEVEVEKLLSLRRVYIKDRWVDIRPYIPKEDSPEDGAAGAVQPQPEARLPNEQTALGNVQFLSFEELQKDANKSAQKHTENFDPTIVRGGQSPPLPGSPQHQYVPVSPFYPMGPVIPFSPGQYPPHMVPHHFFPPQQHFQQEYMMPQAMTPKGSATTSSAMDIRTLDQQNFTQALDDSNNFQANANTGGGDPAPFYAYTSK